MKSSRQTQYLAKKVPFPRFQGAFFAILLFFSLDLSPLLARGSFQVTGGFGPAITLHTVSLDRAAFSGLAGLDPDFDLASADPALEIKGDLFMTAGVEGFIRLTPHWAMGTNMGFGKYQSRVTTDSSNITVIFNLSQFGLVPEFTLNPSNRLKIVLGSVLGISPVALSAATTYSNETWQAIISGAVKRSSFRVTALAPLVQPYLGMDLKVSEFLGLRLVGGYEIQKVAQGSWQLEANQTISDSPAVDYSALFSRLVIYTSF